MTDQKNSPAEATGGCLCGAVQYAVKGPLRHVINCHCSKCRRFHGHIGAYTAVKRGDLVFLKEDGLKWYRSVTDETPNVHRGFCKECGSSLFWDARGSGENICIAAGSLDAPTGLITLGHVWLSQAGDYYELSDDLPRFEASHGGRLS
jgi:hypothetical protein